MNLSILRSALNSITVAANKLSLGNVLVLKVMMTSALLIVFARGIAPFEVGKDQSVQLEAAHRLVGGLGLTSFNFPSTPNDISEPPKAHNVTWWPPGFSLMAASLLFIGMPLLVVLKTIFITVTLMGWLGWSVIASHFFAQPVTYRGKSIPLNLFLAALIPIFFTPAWNGTDIFLWAGVPFVFLCLVNRGESNSPLIYVALAGVLLGFLCSIRYASLFIGIAAVLILFQLSYPAIKSFLKRFVVFIAAFGISFLPTLLYLKWLSQDKNVVPDVVSIGAPKLEFFVVTILDASPSVSNLIFGVPMVEWLILAFQSRALAMLAGAICLAAILGLPWIVARTSKTPFRENLALSLSFFPQSLIIFLFSIALATRSIFFGQKRYYVPVSLCVLFIFYQLFVSQRGSRFITIMAGIVIVPLLVYACLFLPLQAVNPNKFDKVVRQTLGYSPAKSNEYASTSYAVTYPSFQLYSLKENSKRKLSELHKDNPQAIFFVDDYGYYVYDNFQDGGLARGIDVRRLPRTDSTFWTNAYASKTVRVFWVLDPRTEYRIPTSQLKSVFDDPFEKTRIYVSEFQTNARITDATLATGLRE